MHKVDPCVAYLDTTCTCTDVNGEGINIGGPCVCVCWLGRVPEETAEGDYVTEIEVCFQNVIDI